MRDNYIKIPIRILEDQKLTSTAKILYGRLKLLSHKDGYCYASNSHLASLLNVSNRTITRLIKQLELLGYIKLVYCDSYKRKIFIEV